MEFLQLKTPRLDLMEFVEREILPRYSEFDKAHQLSHAQSVIRNSQEIATRCGADIDMCYTIAAYHDLGLSEARAIHHIAGGKILENDVRLRKWFSPQQIRIMKEAIEDHRASASRAPRSLYGKIVAEADRDLAPEHVIRRTIQFSLSNYLEKTKEEHFDRVVDHLNQKYSEHGYIRLWIPNSPNEEKLRELRNIIADPERLRKMFEQIYEEEIKTNNK